MQECDVEGQRLWSPVQIRNATGLLIKCAVIENSHPSSYITINPDECRQLQLIDWESTRQTMPSVKRICIEMVYENEGVKRVIDVMGMTSKTVTWKMRNVRTRMDYRKRSILCWYCMIVVNVWYLYDILYHILYLFCTCLYCKQYSYVIFISYLIFCLLTLLYHFSSIFLHFSFIFFHFLPFSFIFSLFPLLSLPFPFPSLTWPPPPTSAGTTATASSSSAPSAPSATHAQPHFPYHVMMGHVHFAP